MLEQEVTFLLAFVEVHELVDILLTHSYPLTESDTCGRCDRLPTIGRKSTAGIVHDTAIVIVAKEGTSGRILLGKIILSSRSDVFPIDSHIVIPMLQKQFRQDNNNNDFIIVIMIKTTTILQFID